MTSTQFDLQELDSFLSGYWLSDLANFSAYLFDHLPCVNWVGFYLSDSKKLRLGPFCGKPACLEISFNSGVCGKAYIQRSSLIVDDVDQFPGHIRCDSNSKSEMVTPFFIGGEIVGVLDIDSPDIARFKIGDNLLIESAMQILSKKISNYSGVRYGNI